jgi:cysteinyl-tRNA synthetase
LEGQDEKRNSFDFALWKKAQPEHIMRWPSPWGDGFPGWHMECSAMSCKYLGERFDIHGGGMDLMFPHHEAEIAQSVAANGKSPVHYWMHNNMITINGQKMGKSLGNFITLDELFTGKHAALEQAYSPMTIRFFVLQAHYRSTVDFSNEALQASERGMQRLMATIATLKKLKASDVSTIDVKAVNKACYEAMNDDFNSPLVIAALFEGARIINVVNDGKETLTADDITLLQQTFDTFIFEVLGLKDEVSSAGQDNTVEGLMGLILNIRQNARTTKDWSTSDLIRDELKQLSIQVKDTKDGAVWTVGE